VLAKVTVVKIIHEILGGEGKNVKIWNNYLWNQEAQCRILRALHMKGIRRTKKIFHRYGWSLGLHPCNTQA